MFYVCFTCIRYNVYSDHLKQKSLESMMKVNNKLAQNVQ